MKRAAYAALLVLALLVAHVVYWYVPRERAAAPRWEPAGGSLPAAGGNGDATEPLQLLAGGAYDVCLWLPYPHQNLGALAAAAGDLQDVIGAGARLTADVAGVAGGTAAGAADAGRKTPPRRSQEPEELPTFGPFEVPPASELVACSDLAGGRLRVVARIYPALAVVAKLAGRLAGNPWLAGGTAGSTRIAWSGRVWSAAAGAELPQPANQPVQGPLAAPAPGPPAAGAGAPPTEPPSPPAASPGAPETAVSSPHAAAGPEVELPESLAVVHWRGARPEIPAGYYVLTREGSDLTLSLVGAGGAAGASGGNAAVLPPGTGPLPALLLAVGPGWRGGQPDGGAAAENAARFGGTRAGGAAASPSGPLPAAALALFEASSLRVTTLGELPGVAVFNAAGAPGTERWRLPAEGIFHLLIGRLPAAERAGWRILALDRDSLRQAEALAPRLAALMPPEGLAAGAGGPRVAVPAAGPAGRPLVAAPGAGPAGAAGELPLAAPAAGAPLSLGLWLEPPAALRIVSRIRRFVEDFPLASRHEVELWRDWETVLDPLANCGHVSLTAAAAPPAMRLLLKDCTASGPR